MIEVVTKLLNFELIQVYRVKTENQDKLTGRIHEDEPRRS